MVTRGSLLLAAFVYGALRLPQIDQAIVVAERTLQTHPDEESMWSVYADALQPVGRLDDRGQWTGGGR